MQHFPVFFFEWCAKSLLALFEIYSAFTGEFGLIDATYVRHFYESLSGRRIERASSPCLYRKVSVDGNDQPLTIFVLNLGNFES